MGKDNTLDSLACGVRGDNHRDFDRDQGGDDDMGVMEYGIF